MKPLRAVLLALAIALVAAPSAGAARHILTPLEVSTMAAPVPVKGSDGRFHLAYEVRVYNWTNDPVTIQGVQVLQAGSSRVVGQFEGPDAVAGLQSTVQFATPDPADATIGPGQSTILWMNLDFARRSAIPKVLVHRITALGTGPGGVSEQIVMDVARTLVSAWRPPVLAPPLRGTRFVDGNGCCEVSAHTRAIQTFDGRRWLSQRFAIDWVQLDEQGRTYSGDPQDPASYHIYGEPIHAAANGRVVSVLDGRPDQHPPVPDRTLTRANVWNYTTGNHVIIDIGHGAYAMYAHMQPGKIRVREGQRVRRGQVIGLVGNSGNSTEPHLHFHVGSRPLSLEANGLPYVYDDFRVTARVGGDREAFGDAGDGFSGVASLVPTLGSTARHDELPLIWDVVDFG
jgi:hypothetical protein